MKFNVTTFKKNLITILSILAVFSISYKVNGVKIFFFIIAVVILLTLKHLTKHQLKLAFCLNIFIIIFAIGPVFSEWFSIIEFIKSLININMLVLFAWSFYRNIKINTLFAYKTIKIVLIILCASAIWQMIEYQLTGDTTQIVLGDIQIFGGYQIRGNFFRPFTFFSESSYFSVIACGLMLYLLQRKIDSRIVILFIVSQLITFSITGILSIICVVIYIFHSSRKHHKAVCLFLGLLIAFAGITVFSLVGEFKDTPFYHVTIGRIIDTFSSNTADGSSYYRIYYGIEITKEALSEAPFSGIGLGQVSEFTEINFSYVGRTDDTLNNTFYEIFTMFGILGTTVIAIVVGNFIIKNKHLTVVYLYVLFVFIDTGALITLFLWGIGALVYAGDDNPPVLGWLT